MSFWRKLFEMAHGGAGHHRRGGGGHHTRYRRHDHDHDDASWGRHPGSVPPIAPDLICPQRLKQNPPGTRVCKESSTPLSRAACVRCGTAFQAGARYCANCGNPLS